MLTRNTVNNFGMNEDEVIFIETAFHYGQNLNWHNEDTELTGLIDNYGYFVNVQNNYFGHNTDENAFNYYVESNEPTSVVINIANTTNSITTLRQLAKLCGFNSVDLSNDSTFRQNRYFIDGLTCESMTASKLAEYLKRKIRTKYYLSNVVFRYGTMKEQIILS